ncbi:hypothetical protein HDU76_014061 [Blyttiomyces sp. JEL0837]|nr:hypothetical protein HDU76_014061 [Blyttiomyces sp. JEL0837]
MLQSTPVNINRQTPSFTKNKALEQSKTPSEPPQEPSTQYVPITSPSIKTSDSTPPSKRRRPKGDPHPYYRVPKWMARLKKIPPSIRPPPREGYEFSKANKWGLEFEMCPDVDDGDVNGEGADGMMDKNSAGLTAANKVDTGNGVVAAPPRGIGLPVYGGRMLKKKRKVVVWTKTSHKTSV